MVTGQERILFVAEVPGQVPILNVAEVMTIVKTTVNKDGFNVISYDML